eukprot:TRINITY_DN3325_c0_g1_i1.p1 TRINITY_DN3325_c0_g1~~TRINITY_DN3325_c0_g1_i1.p1  ORF type:complete len:256 (-),score=56.81 TRINITY_DN3325_c0_g1_i1:39-779(-)
MQRAQRASMAALLCGLQARAGAGSAVRALNADIMRDVWAYLRCNVRIVEWAGIDSELTCTNGGKAVKRPEHCSHIYPGALSKPFSALDSVEMAVKVLEAGTSNSVSIGVASTKFALNDTWGFGQEEASWGARQERTAPHPLCVCAGAIDEVSNLNKAPAVGHAAKCGGAYQRVEPPLPKFLLGTTLRLAYDGDAKTCTIAVEPPPNQHQTTDQKHSTSVTFSVPVADNAFLVAGVTVATNVTLGLL